MLPTSLDAGPTQFRKLVDDDGARQADVFGMRARH